MRKEIRPLLIGLIACSCLLFIWIGLAVLLTGGRELSEFTRSDILLLLVFAVVEITTVVITFSLANTLGKRRMALLQQDGKAPAPQEKPKTKRGLLFLVAAFVAALLSLLCGVQYRTSAPDWFLGLLIAACAIAPILAGLNALISFCILRARNKQSLEEQQKAIYAHREHAEQTMRQKQRLLKRIKRWSDLYSLLFYPLGFAVAFFAGALTDTAVSVPLCFYSAFLFLCGLSRLRLPPPKTVFEEQQTYVSEQAFPTLYALAKKAEAALGCRGALRICITAECNASISKIGNTYSVQLGAIFLHVISEPELYTVLLHEFFHMRSAHSAASKEAAYHQWLYSGGTPHLLSHLTAYLFTLPDGLFLLHYILYAYAGAVVEETAADRAMAEHGSAEAAAAALRKLQYYAYHIWECTTYDEPSDYQAETVNAAYLSKEAALFERRMAQRAPAWDALSEVEILSRDATHPTLRMRFAAFGLSGERKSTFESSAAYLAERENALHFMDEYISRTVGKDYEKNRNDLYVKPLETVQRWLDAGQPLVAEEYADIDAALRRLGRISEANALCERAIAELPEAASCYAHFRKGAQLLRRYDEAGLAQVYHAIEYNNNYINDGLELIGTFCCLTGNQHELDIYREKALALIQKQMTQYDEISILRKKDRLSAEQLPPDLLAGILEYAQSIADGSIEQLYLIRKTITEDFFTSALIVKFTAQSKPDERNTVMHKLFNYLDTCDTWQFSLFAYSEVAKIKPERIDGSCIYP